MNEHFRTSEFGVNHLILNRWSPRSMTGEVISYEDMMALFDAARWAPSSFNNQPWRFVYSKRDTSYWDIFLDTLVEFNQSWAKNASVLALIISKTVFEKNGNPAKTHAFDAGAAWENLALEAVSRGIVTHAMEGLDYDKARKNLRIPDDFEIHAMIAIGKQDKRDKLSKELQEREMPSGRRPISEIIMEGKFSD